MSRGARMAPLWQVRLATGLHLPTIYHLGGTGGLACKVWESSPT